MKIIFALCCFLATAMLCPGLAAGEWHTNFEKAKAESLKTKRPIYILFTNSDAAPCLSLERTIFSQKKFLDYADRKLVLMKVDFPTAIHLQPKDLKQQNQTLKTKYGISVYPTALLLDANGDIFIDFIKADGSQEKHRRKMNEILGFDPPKRYTEYLDGFVKKYDVKAREIAEKIASEKAAAEKARKEAAAKAAAEKAKKEAEAKAAEKAAKKQQETKPQAPEGTTAIPDDDDGILLVPIDPEGNFQDWLKATSEKGTVEETAEEEAAEIVEEEKQVLEETQEDAAPRTDAPAAQEESASAEK